MSAANIEPTNKRSALGILRITLKMNGTSRATQWKFMVLPLQINVYYFGFQRSYYYYCWAVEVAGNNENYDVDGDELFGLNCSKSIYLHIEDFLLKHHCTQYPLNLAMIANSIGKIKQFQVDVVKIDGPQKLHKQTVNHSVCSVRWLRIVKILDSSGKGHHRVVHSTKLRKIRYNKCLIWKLKWTENVIRCSACTFEFYTHSMLSPHQFCLILVLLF